MARSAQHHVLVVDADERTARAVSAALEGSGAVIDVASDPAAVATIIGNRDFDLVFVSVAFVARSILSSFVGRVGAAPALIAVGEAAEPPLSWEWIGTDRYLAKPLDATAIQLCVNAALDVRRAWLTVLGHRREDR